MLTYANKSDIMLAEGNKRGDFMIPIVFSNTGSSYKIMKIASIDKVKKHLENLGIVKDGTVEVIQNNNGVIILKVKEGRIALNYDLASKIFVEWGF